MNKTTTMWLCAAVGVLWMAIGLRDLFAPHLFSFSPNVAGNSTIVLDFGAGAAFLICAFCLHQAKPITR